MKWQSLALFASAAVAVPTVNQQDRNAVLYKLLSKRDNIIGDMLGAIMNPGYGRVAAPAGAGPTRIEEQARAANVPSSKTVKVRYGPYKVPSMKVKNILGEGGALWNYPDTFVEKPCDECVIVGMNAGLEYPDGKDANIDTGMWLHHMVVFTVGNERKDATCAKQQMSLPHMLIGSSSQYSERFFSSGNERTHAQMPNWGVTNVGYHLHSSDKFSFIVDLMNENQEDKTVYLTLTWDYIPGAQPQMDDMRPVWFDVAQCLTSDVAAPKQTGKFTLTAPTWDANFEGEILGAAGHLHDGGVAMNLYADDKLACKSSATYGATPAYVNNMEDMKMMPSNDAFEHISNMSVCAVGPTLGVKELKKGSKWVLKADYDYYTHRGMLNAKGKQDFLMGISIMYVRIPYVAPKTWSPNTVANTPKPAAPIAAAAAPIAAPVAAKSS